MIRKRVMILASCHTIGGFETKLDFIIKNLDRKKFHLTLLLIYPFYKAKKIPKEVRIQQKKFLAWEGIETIEINMGYRYDFSIIVRAAKWIREKKIDILYFFALGSGTFVAPIAGRMARVPSIVRANDTILDGLYPRLLRGLDRILINMTDLIVVPSEFLKGLMVRELKVVQEKIRVIPNSIQLNKFGQKNKTDSLKAELSLKDDVKIVGMVANLVPVKNHVVLLRAVPYVLERHPETCFLLIGEGPLKSELENLGKELKISSNLRFLGYRSDVEKVILLFYVGILCSKVETHGIALIEMMASGVPVVASRVGGIPEIIQHEDNGLLVNQGDPFALAEAINRLFDDHALAKRIGKNGRDCVFEKFSENKMLRGMEAVFNHRNRKI